MSQTFVFEELDDATRKYLIEVREAKGQGMPGIFAPTTSSFGGCGCLAGLVIIPATLLLTLTSLISVVYDDPARVALLQTAGLMLGGWLILSYFRTRSKIGDTRTAGHWVYADSLNLFVAYREQVTVTPLADVIEANYTHNYNNGNYQNSVVRIDLEDRKNTSFTLNKEVTAERFAAFLNYLAWAHGSDGEEVGKLPPATLGGLARYVARNDGEPRNADGVLNLELVELDVEDIPEEPQREGRAHFPVIPYIVMLVAAVAIYFFMRFVVDPPIRDEATYSLVMTRPTEPKYLRLYLIDPRNNEYREEVLGELSHHYRGVIQHVSTKAQEPGLKEGMIKILNSLKETPGDPVVSIKVTERSPEKLAAGSENRVKKLREEVVGGNSLASRYGIVDLFAIISPAISIPGVNIVPPPTPIGKQLIVFAEPPQEAKNAHFEIIYEFKPSNNEDNYLLTVKVEIRDSIDSPPVASYSAEVSACNGDEESLKKALDLLRANLIRWMVGIPEGIQFQ